MRPVPHNRNLTATPATAFGVPRVTTLALALALAMQQRAVLAELPLPSGTFVTSGAASANVNGANLVINQQSDRAILNWDSYNIGLQNSVTYNQPSHTSIALNQIHAASPSQILGSITANGQVYLYNQNGFIFGEGARVNTASLVATTLNVDFNQFLGGGITNAINNDQPAFFDASGNNAGVIEIQTGAQITANDPGGGRILIIAPDIVNNGTLNSADGQTILAASSDKVYLAASDQDPNLRGLLVEVGKGGTVTNAEFGQILADRGNITLVGLAVNQMGRVRATTSVDRNGSIRLLARDQASTRNTSTLNSAGLDALGLDPDYAAPTATRIAVAQHGGDLVLGEGSITEIALDADTQTAVPDAQQQFHSKVEVMGNHVWMQQDASIVAPSGDVRITARAAPANPLLANTSNDSYVYLDAGSVIDVAGTTDTVLAMERNSLAVEVRSNELADSPLQRDGVLNGATVYVDLREGTGLIDFSGALQNVEKTLSERLAAGGTITLRSEGDVVQRDGSVLDISGGQVAYATGFIRETQLISDRRIYNLSDADEFRQYDAILGVESVEHARWGVTETFQSALGESGGHYVEGYIEGRSAGAVNIAAAATLLASNGIVASTVSGPYQRDPAVTATGGTLAIDLRQVTDVAQNVRFITESLLGPVLDAIAHAPDAITLQRDAINRELLLPDSYLNNTGLAALRLTTNGDVIIEQSAVITARPATTIDLEGSNITMAGTIITHAGEVVLMATPQTVGVANLTIGENALIDTSGQWINDVRFDGSTAPGVPIYKDGGNISLSADGDVVIGAGALLNASGGAWLDAAFDIHAGEGGDIALTARFNSTGDTSTVTLAGELQSYAMYRGGELAIESASIIVNDDPLAMQLPEQLAINRRFFNSGGFSKYSLTANVGELIIDADIQLQALNLVVAADGAQVQDSAHIDSNSILAAPTGTDFLSLAQITTLPGSLRNPVDLALSLDQLQTDSTNLLVISPTASIVADTGAELELVSDTSIHLLGDITAPGGNISFATVTPSTETGYLANQGIWLGADSQINARSDFILTPNAQGLRIGEVVDAGSVIFNANRGYVVIQEGASIDVSAQAVTLDVLTQTPARDVQYQSVEVAPAAGTISLAAAEGIIIDGELHAAAANATGARGGVLQLEIGLDRRGIDGAVNNSLGTGLVKFNFDPRDFVITQNADDVLADSVQTGAAIDNSLNGIGFVNADMITQGGFDSLSLRTQNTTQGTTTSSHGSEVRFESDVDLALSNSLVLNAPTINVNAHTVALQAAYTSIGTASQTRNSIATTPVLDTGALSLDTAMLDVVGDVDITQLADLDITATQDVRFIGATSAQNPTLLSGALNTAADIAITARQLYPATNSQVAINLVNNSAGVLTINGNGAATPILSAGGTLQINAPSIHQGGVIKAPLGELVLNAAQDLQLLSGGLSSVSAEGQIIPYGVTINAGETWNYNINGRIIPAALPDAAIELIAPNIEVQAGAVVDVSGGGDAVAWEYVPGPLGKSDVLLVDAANNVDNTGGAFAILPQSHNQYAPYDVLHNNANYAIGSSVYLSAGNGLAAGYYTILPARYALLPGAMLVTPMADISNIYPGKIITRSDGVAIIPGKFAQANTDIIDSTWSAFVVEDGSVARTRSEYIETFATQFFNGATPEDAGALVVDAALSLSLAGSIVGDHVDGARGSRVDILADNIEIVSQVSTPTSGFIQLLDADISQLNIDSIMLGGRRSISGDNEVDVAVRSGAVVVREDAQLTLPEIYIVAKDSIALASGAGLEGAGNASGAGADQITLDNNASILGASVNPLATVVRTGSSAGADIVLAASSTLAAASSVVIDSSGEVQLGAAIMLSNGGLRLGANQVNLGNVLSGTSGLNITTGLLSGLSLAQLDISSRNAIAIYDDLDVTFTNVEFSAPGINGISTAAAAVSITATGLLALTQNGNTAVAAGQGGGSLNLNAASVEFANGAKDFVIDGFDAVNINAVQSIVATATNDAGIDFKTAKVTLDTPLVTTDVGALLALYSSSHINFVNTSGADVDTHSVHALGGELLVQASQINVDTRIAFPSGLISLNSNGASAADGTTLADQALLDVSGRSVSYVDGSVAGSSAGVIELTTDNGAITSDAASQLNLAASSVAGDAGQLVLSAPLGDVAINSNLVTAHAAGFAGASFSLDALQVADLPALLQRIQLAQFTASQDYRLRSGDITLAARVDGVASIQAHDIMLAADNGQINIAGVLDASGDEAGDVQIFAAGDVTLSGAHIDASAHVDTAGGVVTIGTNAGVISADAQSQLLLAGANNTAAGKLTLRAPRTNANTDVAINSFEATVSGAAHIAIEGVASYNHSSIGSTQQTQYRNEAKTWLDNASTMATRLGLDTDSRVRFLSGVDVFSAGDITITNAIDFYQWQSDTSDVVDVGAFTVRAGNNLNINATISDGIKVELLYSIDLGGFILDGPTVPVLKPGESWNYRLASGADLTAANPLATLHDSIATTGNLTLASNVSVRTGTGDIALASGGNVKLTSQTSTIYTAGTPNDGKYTSADLDLFGLLFDGAQFADQGGDINITLAGDFIGAASNQFFTDWLQRAGGDTVAGTLPGTWGVVLNDFQQGIATLGGGDITLAARGNVTNLSVSTPRTGQIDVNDDVVIRGGGDIDITAGGDLLSARVLADGGDANIKVRGKVAAAGAGLNTLLAMGDARVRIEAGDDINIEGVSNYSLLPLSTLQTSNSFDIPVTDIQSYFFTYADSSRLELLSHYGDVILNNDTTAISSAANNRSLSVANASAIDGWAIYPGDLEVATLDGDIRIHNPLTLFPDADGNLELLSANDITARNDSSTTAVNVQLSDADVRLLPGIRNPDNLFNRISLILTNNSSDESQRHAATPVHQLDDAPASIVANNSIVVSASLKFALPKSAHIYAGVDIINLAVEIQNLHATDVSLFIAGGDIRYPLSPLGIASSGIRVTGPGSIDIIAGGKVDLGDSLGIRSLGNLKNPALPVSGADISVYAGVGDQLQQIDSAAFIDTYLSGVSADTAALYATAPQTVNGAIVLTGYQQQLVSYIASDNFGGDFAAALLAVTAQTFASRADAVAAFNSLDAQQQLAVALGAAQGRTLYELQLLDYVAADSYGGDLATALTTVTADTYANHAEALAAFTLLDAEQQLAVAKSSFASSALIQQRSLLLNIMFDELQIAAINQATNRDESEYARGFDAISALFNTDANQTLSLTGDIRLPFSRITTTAGGDINLLAPNGELVVGYTAEVVNRSLNAGALGVIVNGAGDLSALSQGNVSVNLSRVLTLDGGDITLWSSSGDIDAGRGAKTELSIPPVTTLVGQDGNITVIQPPAVSGSGIGAAVFTAGKAPGKVTLAAPGGVINASDAGIRSQGNLVLAATQVLGGDNISAGGTAVGIPVATNVTAGISGLSSAADSAINSAGDAITSATDSAIDNAGVALVTVEFLGAGDE